jgi:uncharacterized membrane protein YccF (DUF307 family)
MKFKITPIIIECLATKSGSTTYKDLLIQIPFSISNYRFASSSDYSIGKKIVASMSYFLTKSTKR